MSQPLWNEEEVRRSVPLFEALADAKRLRLLQLLQKEQQINVSQLAKLLAMKQSNVSHHLAILAKAGLTRVQRRGTQAFYSLSEGAFEMMLERMKVFLFKPKIGSDDGN